MDAFLSDKECWYYMKLLTFTLGIGMEVLHQYFEQKILQSMDFYVFVEKYKHYLFHECFPTVQCCECSQMPLAVHSKKGCLNEIQFQLLFEITTPSKPDHYKTGRNDTIVKDCLCRIDAKISNEVDCMDITLMCAIIKSCLLNNNIPIHGNPRFLETIKETRNFLAHSTDLRITKSEFDTRWDKTEHAVIEIASVVGNYFLKLQKRKIDAFKDNELSMENIKTIIDNNADEVKKNLQTLVADQRKNTILIKDEIIENLTKYKDYLDELSIDIGSLKFEVKQSALAVVASCSAEETFDSQVHQKDAATRSSEVSVTEKETDNRCRVEWRLETPSTWNLLEIKETLEKFSALLRQWFEIEFVYVGSLVIKTLVQKNVLDNKEQMRKSIHSFLEKIVDVCKIKTDVSTVIKVALIIYPGKSDYKGEAEEQTSKIEINKKDKTTCIFCNKSFDCQNCLQKAKIISRLEDELSENRKESSAISLESVVSVTQNIGVDIRANKAEVATVTQNIGAQVATENIKESSTISLESVVSEMDKDSPEIKSLKSESVSIENLLDGVTAVPGSSLGNTTLSSIMPRNYHVVFGIEVENLTKYKLVNSETYLTSGEISIPASDIRPGYKEAMVATKKPYWPAFGICGIVSWLISGCNRRLVIMFTLPWPAFLNYIEYTNKLSVGISDVGITEHDSKWHKAMKKLYNTYPGLNFKTEEYINSTRPVKVADETFQVSGIMGTGHQIEAKIVFKPYHVDNLKQI